MHVSSAVVRRVHRLTSALALVTILVTTSGCGVNYYVFEHPGMAGEQVVPKVRRPLQAAFSTSSDALNPATEVRSALQASGWFSTLDAPRSTADVAIVYQGVTCGEPYSYTDNVVGGTAAAIKAAVFDLPTLGMVSSRMQTEDCTMNFGFEVLKPSPFGGYASGYDYKRHLYGVNGAAKSLYASPEKQAYQLNLLYTSAVNRLLEAMAPAIAALQTGS